MVERTMDMELSPAQKSRKRIAVISLTLVSLVVIAIAWHFIGAARGVGTDDAQIAGHVMPVSARIPGYVTEVRVEENQVVHAGDTLVALDDRDLRAKLAQANAELAAILANAGEGSRRGQADAQVSVAQAGAAAAQASVAQAQANAERARNDLARYRALAKDRIVSQQQLDAAETAVRTAEAQLLAARRNAQAASEQIVAAQAGLQGADARLAAARAARDQVALQLEHTRIVAQASGVVSKRAVEIGQLVQPGQPLFSIVPLDDVWIVANLKETDVRRIHAGDPVDIHVDAYPGHSFEGKVESTAPATGSVFSLLPADNATGNFVKVVQRIPVRIRLDGTRDADTRLRPGMNAVVRIHPRD